MGQNDVSDVFLANGQGLRRLNPSRNRAVNLRSVFLGCKYSCAQFLEQDLGPDGQRGWIVNISSILGLVGYRNGAGLCCSFLFKLSSNNEG